MTFDFRETSVWVETPDDLRPGLEGDERADVAVIGGGITGLSTALALREAGVDVVLMEMDYCGRGASGRNAGHLTSTIGKDLPTLVKSVGKARAAELARFADKAVRHTEGMFAKYEIDCDYRPVGNIIAGLHRRHREPLRRSAGLAASIGIKTTFLPEAEMSRRNVPPAFRFGVLERSGGHLHPGKYVMGLRRAALAAGVRVFEGARVIKMSASGSPVRVTTPTGVVRADKIVLATNAYTPVTLGVMKSRVFPLRDTLFQTAPLTGRQLAALGWEGREGVYTAHESLESYRLTADNRIVGGSKYVQYGYGGALVDGNMPELFARFTTLLKDRFPQVPDLAIESFWGGWLDMTLDFLPLSFSNARRNVLYGMGYNGHGVAQATLNGAMLADQILGRPNEHVELLKRNAIPLPPEPLRWLAVRALQWRFDRIDQAIDADLRLKRR